MEILTFLSSLINLRNFFVTRGKISTSNASINLCTTIFYHIVKQVLEFLKEET